MAIETTVSPIGKPAAEASSGRASRNERYRRQRDQFATTREIARQVILFRTETGLTQEQLARRLETSAPQICRIESGRYMPSGKTLAR
jgi:ribosome-binding protein aMBF1 (putative translation factor)